MGTLEGHLLSGVGFLMYAFYYSSLTSLALLQKQTVLNHLLLPRKLLGHRLIWQVSYEAVMKVIVPAFGIIGEYFYPLGVNRLKMIDWKDPRRLFIFKDNWQHVTMFGFFILSGVVDIVSQAQQARWSMKLERAAEALAFYVLGLLMITHIENKNALEIRVHLLLVLPAFLLALVLTVEIWVPDNAPLWVLKSWMGLVLSTWMMQICEMYIPLTGQPWRADNPMDLAFVAIFFCWHLALGVALLIAIYGLCSLWHRHASSWTKTLGTKYQRCPTESGGEELEKLSAEAVPQDGGV
ncbi:transmembrane epididymal protein 1A-like [Rattus norvegicus]|uniref:Transmembrane epididymal family member 3 n=1 Tax=Rattus norvegicus TaxID=10116 RepID=A0A8I6AKS7_RAT|nr:transmembrane epididymal protein 1A-like [Rattus norvegicus]|eukprot:XP_221310.4 PREDICTED: transmembrane epididymal protein 1A-like [Rattus norvegicus]